MPIALMKKWRSEPFLMVEKKNLGFLWRDLYQNTRFQEAEASSQELHLKGTLRSPGGWRVGMSTLTGGMRLLSLSLA